MGLLAENTTPAARLVAAKGLISLAEVMNEANKNDLRSRQVGVAEKALQMKLDPVKKKAAEALGIKDGNAEKPVPLTRDQLLDKVREIYGAV